MQTGGTWSAGISLAGIKMCWNVYSQYTLEGKKKLKRKL